MSNQTPSDERGNDLAITVCANGVVNVWNQQSGSGDAHSVFLGADGDVLRCSCPGYKYNGHCYHADAIEERPLVTASATAAAESYAPVATDGGTGAETDDGRERARFAPLDAKDEVADEQYCSKYIVPVSECVFSDGEECPHEVLTADGGQRDTGADTADGPTCDDCGLLLADAHEQPAGYTRLILGDDGEYVGEICGACADIRGGHPRGERKTADEVEA